MTESESEINLEIRDHKSVIILLILIFETSLYALIWLIPAVETANEFDFSTESVRGYMKTFLSIMPLIICYILMFLSIYGSLQTNDNKFIQITAIILSITTFVFIMCMIASISIYVQEKNQWNMTEIIQQRQQYEKEVCSFLFVFKQYHQHT